MLNLLRTHSAGRRLVLQEVLAASGLGLLMGLMGLCYFEVEASKALAMATSSASVNGSVNGSVNALVSANQAMVPLADTQAAELAQAQQAAAENLARLAFLRRRQSLREDVTDVQEAWLLSRLGNTQSGVKLQSQQWLQGQFTWEGVAAQSIDLQALVHTLSRFQHWHQAPVVTQMQAESADQSAGQHKALIFQLLAVLQPTTGDAQ